MKSFSIAYSFIKICIIYVYKYIFYFSLINKEKLKLIIVIKKMDFIISNCIVYLYLKFQFIIFNIQ